MKDAFQELELFHLSGFIHVITEEGAKVNKVQTK